MRLKRTFFGCALLTIVLCMIVNTTLAYYTAAETARNVITSSGIRISLSETTDTGAAFEDVVDVMPGDTVSKIVTVENEQAEAWVRVWVAVTAVHPVYGEVEASPEQLFPGESEISADFNTADWTYNEDDGHFYYNAALATGESTAPLFTGISFDAEEVGNDWQNCKLIIAVTAEAVQTANNPEAIGWGDCGHAAEPPVIE